MQIDSFDTDRRVLLVAEIGNNHEGSFGLAQELIRRAAAAGADAVKFQTFRTEHYVGPQDAARFERLKRFELTHEQFERLARLAAEHGLLFLSTPFDLASARLLGRIAAAIKIASGDNTFVPLLEAAARTGKPLIISGGLADLDTLRYAQAIVRRVWRDGRTDQQLAFLHCVSAYPVPAEQANLAAIPRLAGALGCTVGYSDHTLGIEAAVLAVAAGARILEKHFTLDKNHSDFRDHQLSADPAELAELVRRVRAAEKLLGNGRKVVQPCESDACVALRRSIAAQRDLPAGTIVTAGDITWLRPGGGFVPGREADVLGHRLTRAVAAGAAIPLDALEGAAPA